MAHLEFLCTLAVWASEIVAFKCVSILRIDAHYRVFILYKITRIMDSKLETIKIEGPGFLQITQQYG